MIGTCGEFLPVSGISAVGGIGNENPGFGVEACGKGGEDGCGDMVEGEEVLVCGAGGWRG